MYQKIMQKLAELEQRLANVHRIGTIEQTDYTATPPTATVRFNETHVSGKLPLATIRAGGDVSWWVPDVGEQVLITAPNGDLDRAIIGPSLYQTAHPAPETLATKHTTTYADGAVITYDRENSVLTATLPAGGTANLIADGGINLTGDLTVTGNIIATIDVEDATGKLSRLRDNYNAAQYVGNLGALTSTTNKPDA